jgi:hypothetical protein
MFSGLTIPDGADWKLEVECPTGTCIFLETYNSTHFTMGICNSCIDITSKLEKNIGEKYWAPVVVSLPSSMLNITLDANVISFTDNYNQSWIKGMDDHFDAVTCSAFSGLPIMSFTLLDGKDSVEAVSLPTSQSLHVFRISESSASTGRSSACHSQNLHQSRTTLSELEYCFNTCLTLKRRIRQLMSAMIGLRTM